MQKLVDFIGAWLDRANAGNTAANAGQCVGLIALWLDACGAPHVWGNAVDLLDNAPLTSYRVFRNAPTNYPVAGDVLVWDKTWGNGYGHCGVVIGGTVNVLAVFEANNPAGHAPAVLMHGYQGVAGWLRPRGTAD